MSHAGVGGKKSPAIADASFREALHHIPDALEDSFTRVIKQGQLPIKGLSVTRSVLLRMVAFYEMHYRIKQFLSKRYTGPAADFFVETVVFYLKALAITRQLNIEVASELQLKRARGAMRPDISVWRNNRCLACVECKTQLGWNRGGWESQFLEREERLLADFAGASTFLLVLTADNWGGFGENPQLGKKYFVLSEIWPTHIDFDRLEDIVVTPIEGLLARVVNVAKADGRRAAP